MTVNQQEELGMVKLSMVAVFGLLVGAAPQDAKSIKDVMNAVHKGEDSLFKKIVSGKGSDEEHKKVVGMWEFLATQKPPKGDEASWKAKTAALLAAGKDVESKKAGGLDTLKKAGDCKGCHSVHKPAK
jgi:hypothetical protein